MPLPTFCRFSRRWLIAGGLGLLLLFLFAAGAAAQDEGPNASCIGCHSTSGLAVELASGEILSLTVAPEVYNASVHGAADIACVACHTNISGYPHSKLTAGDHRSFQLERYTQCQTCHQEQYKETLDSNHALALAAGNREAAICTDCHGAHDIADPDEPRQKISHTCEKCHSTIFEQYADSVHGAALLEASNPDVPVCTDCHGTHTQEDPTTVEFRLKSPSSCGDCHGDAALMQKYGISTDVFNTYVADFHGTTITLFEKQTPDHPSNKAVCTDCHGIHDIQQVTAADATVVKENLLVNCQQCHPDATTNFPDSWIGHFPPSRDIHPLVYYVNLFYNILIPAVIGAMVLFVLLDAARRVYNRIRRSGTSSAKGA